MKEPAVERDPALTTIIATHLGIAPARPPRQREGEERGARMEAPIVILQVHRTGQTERARWETEGPPEEGDEIRSPEEEEEDKALLPGAAYRVTIQIAG